MDLYNQNKVPDCFAESWQSVSVTCSRQQFSQLLHKAISNVQFHPHKRDNPGHRWFQLCELVTRTAQCPYSWNGKIQHLNKGSCGQAPCISMIPLAFWPSACVSSQESRFTPTVSLCCIWHFEVCWLQSSKSSWGQTKITLQIWFWNFSTKKLAITWGCKECMANHATYS